MKIEEFKQIITTFQPRLHAFANSILRNEFASEDIVQDVFCFVWENRSKLDSINNTEAYIVHILKCRCIDYLRKHKKEVLEEEISNLDYREIKEDSEERYNKLLELISQLPENQQELLHQKYFKNKKIKEISQETGLSEGNIRTSLSRAYSKLKDLIAKPKI
ncbi:MAG: sigma-70 family RNA polymerase sigma factor [Bacteroidales bacterium]|nr:sigma-70 family RNA polymerase sigma factor [Bacteroidales bacterium]